MAAKMGRDFDRADALREELRGMGVRVEDRLKEWRFATPVKKDFGATGHDLTRSVADGTACGTNGTYASRTVHVTANDPSGPQKCKASSNSRSLPMTITSPSSSTYVTSM